MDGSRRYSKVYGKTQSGVDALTTARGALSSSARQLLILLDGQRNFDELTGIFGEETLYRLLPQLESQGYIEPLQERSEAQDIAAPPTTRTREPAPTLAPKTLARPTTVLREPATTIAPKTVARSTTITRETATTIAPKTVAPDRPTAIASAAAADPATAQRPTKSPRFLAVPIAIAASLLTASALVNWIFEREQHVREVPPAQDAAPQKSSAVTPGNRSGAAPTAGALPTEIAPPAPPPAAPQPQTPSRALSLPPVQAPPATPDAAAQTVETGTLVLRATKAPPPEANAAGSIPPVTEASARSTETTSRSAPRAKAAPEPVASASKPAPTRAVDTTIKPATVPPGPGPEATAPQATPPAPAVSMLHVRSRVLPTISKRALQSGIYGGSAVVRLHINSKGAVERVELVSANPPEVYGPDVQQALEQWTFEPPSNPAQFTLELDFRQQAPASATEAGKSAGSNKSQEASKPQETSKPAEVSAPVDAP